MNSTRFVSRLASVVALVVLAGLALAGVKVPAGAAEHFEQGTVAVARNADGRLELFGTDSSNRVWHRWQSSAQSSVWTSWAPLEGRPMNSVAAEANADGRLELFGLTESGAIYHRWQTSGGWSPWRTIPGILRSVAVARNLDGKLELVGTNDHGAIWHARQRSPGTPESSDFGPWELFEGQLRAAAVEANADGRLELVGVNAASTIWRRRQTAPGDWSGSSWLPVDGLLTSVAVARGGDGRLEIFGANGEGSVYHRTQSAPNSGSWSAWRNFDDSQFGGRMRSVAAEADSSGSLTLLSANDRGMVYEQHQASGTWSGFKAFPVPLWVPPALVTYPLAADTQVHGDTSEHVLVSTSLTLRAGESRRVLADVWAAGNVLFGTAVRCVDAYGAQPIGSITAWAETNLVTGQPQLLRPAMVLRAPATGTYSCRLIAYAGEDRIVTVAGGWTRLQVSAGNELGAHGWAGRSCDSAGREPTCVYIGRPGGPVVANLFDDGTSSFAWIANDSALKVSASANVEVTTCGHTASCGGLEANHSSTTVASRLEIIQLNAQNGQCALTTTGFQTDVVGVVPHHYNIPYRIDNIPVSPDCGTRNFRLRVHLIWIAGNPLKIDGSRPDSFGLQTYTNAYMINSATTLG